MRQVTRLLAFQNRRCAVCNARLKESAAAVMRIDPRSGGRADSNSFAVCERTASYVAEMSLKERLFTFLHPPEDLPCFPSYPVEDPDRAQADGVVDDSTMDEGREDEPSGSSTSREGLSGSTITLGGAGAVARRASGSDQVRNARSLSVHCPICSLAVQEPALPGHIGAAHVNSAIPTGLPLSEYALGVQVLVGIAKRQRWVVSHSESCDRCRRRVAFLDVGAGKQKAFDVGPSRVLLGTHLCSDSALSESVFTYSGGAIDSNRSRH